MSIDDFRIELYNEVFALWRDCNGIGLSSADSRECIQNYLERNPGMSFVAVADGSVVGTILGGHDGRRGYIHHLAVRSVFRRKGLGRRLVDRCLGVLADAGIQKCHVFVIDGNDDGIAFWESAGWSARPDILVVSKIIKE